MRRLLTPKIQDVPAPLMRTTEVYRDSYLELDRALICPWLGRAMRIMKAYVHRQLFAIAIPRSPMPAVAKLS